MNIAFESEGETNGTIVENQKAIDEKDYERFRRGVVDVPRPLYLVWAFFTTALIIGMAFAILQFHQHHDDAHQGYQTGVCVANETMMSPYRNVQNVLDQCEEFVGVDVSENAGWW